MFLARPNQGFGVFPSLKPGKLCSRMNIFYVFTGKKADASWVSQKLALSTTEEILCHLYTVQTITNALQNINRSKSISGVSADSSYGRIREQLKYLHYFPGGSASSKNTFYNVRNYFGHDTHGKPCIRLPSQNYRGFFHKTTSHTTGRICQYNFMLFLIPQ